MPEPLFHSSRLLLLQAAGNNPPSSPSGSSESGEIREVTTGGNCEPLGSKFSRSTVGVDPLNLSARERTGPSTNRQSVETPFAAMEHRSTLNGFDFGSGQPLPPPRRPLHNPFSVSRFQSLAASNDPKLLHYINRRHISIGFLNEIDQFLRCHPELWEHSPGWSDRFNSSTPFDAYRYFLKGYTKPARYIPGYLPDVQTFLLPQHMRPGKISDEYDEELADFFDGQLYRLDILNEIDRLVDLLCYNIQTGVWVKNADRKLVVYALWGNPIDAYKYFEYNYQTVWLPHRYLPEHVALSDVPKVDDYCLPIPRVIDSDEQRRSHYPTRLRMARANDNGIDVLDVLISEFVAVLSKKGHRRPQIESLRIKAIDAINRERDGHNDPRGPDLVDLVMSLADAQPHMNRPNSHPPKAPLFLENDNIRLNFTAAEHSGAVVSSTQFKAESLTQVSQVSEKSAKAKFGLPQPVNGQQSMKFTKRCHTYAGAKARLQCAKAEEASLRYGPADKLTRAIRTRIGAERHFAQAVMSWNKEVKKLTKDQLNILMKVTVGTKKNKIESSVDLLTLFGHM